MFSPTTDGNTYWPQVYTILRDAADDLGIELLVYEFDVTDRFAREEEALAILQSTTDIDGAIFSVAVGQAPPLVAEAERRGFPVMINGPLHDRDIRELGGGPRTRFSQWVGYFYQDEEEKGYRLGRVLLQAAREDRPEDSGAPIAVAGIGGDHTWSGSALRADGLRRAVAEDGNARLLQIVPTQWTEREGITTATRLLARYPEIEVLWAASDQLAIGAGTAIASRRLEAATGDDVVTGGLDMSPRGLLAVRDGVLVATASSTLFTFAEALVCLYDYIHGHDFVDDVGSTIQTSVQVATQETATTYIELYDRHREIDFRRFSKAFNPDLDRYDFSPAAYRRALHASIPGE